MRGQWMAALLVVASLGGPAARVEGQVVAPDRALSRMAAAAESAEQHERVAAEARGWAAQLDRDALRDERTARRLERQWFPNEYKTAPMLQPGYRERQRAAKARHGARQARVLAERHDRIAEELRNAP